jgi:poly-gamma-glutamate biosynthesis protein PgsC/CapC
MPSGDLTPEMTTLALGIGLVFSLTCYLLTNLSPGGMITPGWLGVIMVESPEQGLIVLGATVVTVLLVKVLQRIMILYGKRLFAAVVLTGVLLQLTVYLLVQRQAPLLFTHETLGFVVPGLITYQLVRQRPVPTVLATFVTSAATYVVVISGVLAGLLPVLT